MSNSRPPTEAQLAHLSRLAQGLRVPTPQPGTSQEASEAIDRLKGTRTGLPMRDYFGKAR